jgi:transposase-like protein
MPSKNEPRKQYEETFKLAAVELLNKSGGNFKETAAELGIDPKDLRSWKRKAGGRPKPAKAAFSGMARLRAENEALRSQILNLQVQWDILKTTLGVLSTTVCTREGT